MSVGRQLPRRQKKQEKADWNGRTFLAGNMCFRSRKKQKTSTSYFYYEQFEVNANPPAKLNVEVKIVSGFDCMIKCVRMLLPNRLVTPVIEGLSGPNISVVFDTEWFPFTFYFSIFLAGSNVTIYERKK